VHVSPDDVPELAAPDDAVVMRPLVRSDRHGADVSLTWVRLDGRHRRLRTDRSTRVYYVLDGTAELTLGGTLDQPREATPGEWKSKKINGGTTIRITQGDLIVVPRGTPQQRNTVDGKEFSMILIKVFSAPIKAK